MLITNPSRLFYRRDLNAGYDEYDNVVLADVDASTANVVSSLCADGYHRPALDIDIPAMLIPSTTPGHSHLYLDRPMEWVAYLNLLKDLTDLGIIQTGVLRGAERRLATFLRLPHIAKVESGDPLPWLARP